MSTLTTLFELLPRYGTVREFSDFIRSKGISGGATWQVLEDRVRSAIPKGKVDESDLIGFLRDAEEYGHQRVFLYQRPRGGREVPTADEVNAWLESIGSPGVGTTVIVDMPARTTLSEVRRDSVAAGEVVTIKLVETRVYSSLVSTKEHGGGRFTKEYQRKKARAVNVMRIHAGGLVELRIQQHESGSLRYEAERNRCWSIVRDLVDPAVLTPVTFVTAKATLYADRHALAGVVDFSGDTLRRSTGKCVVASCGRYASLFDDARTEEALAVLASDDEAYHDGLNLWWRKQKSGIPSHDVHVLLSGDANEFAITQQCSRENYEHVFKAIVERNG